MKKIFLAYLISKEWRHPEGRELPVGVPTLYCTVQKAIPLASLTSLAPSLSGVWPWEGGYGFVNITIDYSQPIPTVEFIPLN